MVLRVLRFVAAVGLLTTTACSFQAQQLSNVSNGAFSATVTNLRVGQPTQLTLSLQGGNGAAVGVAAAFQVTDANNVTTTFATGITDASGEFTGSWTYTGAPPNNPNGLGATLGASVLIDGNYRTMPSIAVTIFPASPAFEIVPQFSVANTNVVTAGANANFVLYALDAGTSASNSNAIPVDASFVGVVAFAANGDPNATVPATVTFTAADQGHIDLSGFTFTHAPTVTLTAYAVTAQSVNGNVTFGVTPAAATGLQIVFQPPNNPNNVVAGEQVTVTVVPTDQYGNTAPFNGNVILTISGSPVTLACNSNNSACTGTFSEPNAGTYTLSASGSGPGGSVSSPPVQTQVSPGTANGFNINAISNVTMGQPATFVVTAVDSSNNTVIDYTGAVTFGSSDTAATFAPSAYTFTTADAGVHTFTNGAVFNTWSAQPTVQTLVVASTGSGAPLRGTATVNVYASKPYYTISLSTNAPQAGIAVNATVAVYDPNNNLVSSVSDQFMFTYNPNDGTAAVAGRQSMGNNPTTVSNAVTFTKVGTYTLSVFDATTNGNILTATTPTLNVAAGPAATFRVLSNPNAAVQDTPFTVDIGVYDNYNNIVAAYTGTVNVTTSDPNGSPGITATTFQFDPNNGGILAIPITFGNTGSQTVDISSTSLSPGLIPLLYNVSGAPVATFAFAGLTNAAAGASQTCVLTALDAQNHKVGTFTGAVTFTSSDHGATLPSAYTFTTVDNGAHTFGGSLSPNTLVFVQAGTQTLTASSGGISATSAPFNITGASASHLSLDFNPNNQVPAGSAVTMTVTALDAYNNPASNFTHTVTFSAANLAPYTFTGSPNAVASVTFTQAGNTTVAVGDTSSSPAASASANVNIVAGNTAAFTFVLPSSATAATNATCSVHAVDAYGNMNFNYRGSITITSSDPRAYNPNGPVVQIQNTGLTNFFMVFGTVGPQTITGIDSVHSITGTSGSLQVNPGNANTLTLSAAGITSGPAPLNANITVVAKDVYGNPTPLITTGTASVTDSQGAAIPAAITFSAGTATFTARFVTENGSNGPYSVTVVDNANTNVTGTLGGFLVTGPSNPNKLVLSVPTPTYVCNAIPVTVTLEDAYGNVANSNATVNVYANGNIFGSMSATNGVASFTYGTALPNQYTFMASSSFGTQTFVASLTQGTPQVTFTTYNQSNGCVSIGYSVTNTCSSNISASYIAGTASGVASLGPNLASAGVINVPLANGNQQVFEWDSTRDLPNYNGTASLTITVPGVTGATRIFPLTNGTNLSALPSSFSATGTVTEAHGDLNHNDLGDFAVAIGAKVYVSLDGLSNSIGSAPLSDSNSQVTSMVIERFTTDGNTEIVGCARDATNSNNNGFFALALSGNTIIPAMPPMAADCHAVRTIDVNRDGLRDLVTVDSQGNLVWYLNQSTSSLALQFGAANTYPINAGTTLQPLSFIVGDYDRNGALDVLLTPQSGGNVLIFYGDGATLGYETVVPTTLSGPVEVAVADFNRDDLLDMAVEASGGDVVIPFMGVPATLGAVPFTNTFNSFAISGSVFAAMDVNGDGHPDIVSASSSASAPTLTTFLYTPGGSFTAGPTATLSMAGPVVGLGAAQLVQRDELDIVVIGQGVGALSNTRPHCNPTLGAPGVFGVGSNLVTSALADVNNDGRWDIVTVDANHSIVVNRGTGVGGLAAPIQAPATDTNTVWGRGFVADMDGDGNVDLVIPRTTLLALTPSLAIFPGSGGTSFAANANFIPLPGNGTAVQAVPLALQGNTRLTPDVAIITSTGSAGYILSAVNHSTPHNFAFGTVATSLSFSPMAMVATATHPDLNGDGNADLGILASTGTLWSAWSVAGGSFNPNGPTGSNQRDVASGDFNGDGFADFYTLDGNGALSFFANLHGPLPALATPVVNSNAEPQCIGTALVSASGNSNWYLGVLCDGTQRASVVPVNPDGTLSTLNVDVPMGFSGATSRFYLADMSGDLVADAITVSADGNIIIAKADATYAWGHFQSGDSSTLPSEPHLGFFNSNANSLALTDYSLDGYYDAMVADPTSTVVTMYDSVTAGKADWMGLQTFNGSDAVTADFNRNGVPELATLSGPGIVTLSSGQTISSGLPLNRLAAVDLNGDGWTDLAGIGYGAGVVWWINTQNPNTPFTSSPTGTLTGVSPTSYVFGDFTHSGKSELLLATSTNYTLYLLGSTLTTLAQPPLPVGMLTMDAADIDGDGRLDLLLDPGFAIEVYRNLDNGPTFSNVGGCPLLGHSTDRLAVGDLDQNGVPDVAVPIAGTGTVNVCYFNATFGNTLRAVYETGYNTGMARIADINNDSVNDLTATCADANGWPVTRAVVTEFGGR